MFQNEATWIDIGGRLRGVVLQEHLRAYLSLQNLPHPEIQSPQLIAILGDRTKRKLAKSIFSLQFNAHEKILLHRLPISNRTSPLLLADCELHICRTPTDFNTGIVQRHPLKWHQNVPQSMDLNSVANLIYAKLLLPFSTVFCIFAKDFGDIKGVALMLSTWLKSLRSRSTEYSSSTFTRILVLVERHDCAGFDEKLATTEFIIQLRRVLESEICLFRQLGHESLTNVEFERLLKDQFFEIRILPLPSPMHDHVKAQTNILRTRILQESQDIYNLRKAAKMTFSARHFVGFFNYACDHFAKDIVSPFSFIRASRYPNPVPIDFGTIISEFVQIVPSENRDMIAPVVASALRLDNFPPGAHVFNVNSIFKELYSKMLSDALASCPEPNIAKEIEAEFCRETDYLNTAFFHQKLIQNFAVVWKDLSSNMICFFCLARASEIRLECRHSICETCFDIHGKSSLDEPEKVSLHTCPFCKSSTQIEIKLKPNTAGVRGLVIDGGTKFDFEALDIIEKELGLPIKITEHFDISYASGLGAWELIERLCTSQTPETAHNFQKINRAFYKENDAPISRFSQSTKLSNLSSYEVGATLKRINGALKTIPRWGETMQSSMMVISTLHSMFKDKTLFEFGRGQRLGIVVTRTKDSTTCVLSNYNGTNRQPLAYNHIRENKTKSLVLLSQCARISLLQKSIRGYQANRPQNPKEIIDIIHEEQNMIWKRNNRALDILVAVGTHVPIYDQTVPKVIYPNLIDYRIRYDREKLRKSIDLLLASMFYVELIGIPQPNELGTFSCRIQIRCRLSPSSREYRSLVEKLQRKRARFYFDYQSIPCVSEELFNEFKRGIAFSRCLELTAQSMNEAIDVKIDGITSKSRSISNCPYELRQLVEDQRLNCIFGNKDHRERYFGSTYDKRGKFF